MPLGGESCTLPTRPRGPRMGAAAMSHSSLSHFQGHHVSSETLCCKGPSVLARSLHLSRKDRTWGGSTQVWQALPRPQTRPRPACHSVLPPPGQWPSSPGGGCEGRLEDRAERSGLADLAGEPFPAVLGLGAPGERWVMRQGLGAPGRSCLLVVGGQVRTEE